MTPLLGTLSHPTQASVPAHTKHRSHWTATDRMTDGVSETEKRKKCSARRTLVVAGLLAVTKVDRSRYCVVDLLASWGAD